MRTGARRSWEGRRRSRYKISASCSIRGSAFSARAQRDHVKPPQVQNFRDGAGHAGEEKRIQRGLRQNGSWNFRRDLASVICVHSTCRRRCHMRVLMALSCVIALAASYTPKLRVGRRGALGLAAGAATVSLPAFATPTLDGYNPAAAVTAASKGRQYFPPLTPPLFKRASYRYELGRDAWALEQLLTFANVSATVRTVVVKLKDGSLWSLPQWPTGEFALCSTSSDPSATLSCPASRSSTSTFGRLHQKVSKAMHGSHRQAAAGECGLTAASAKMGYRVDGVGAPKPRPAPAVG